MAAQLGQPVWGAALVLAPEPALCVRLPNGIKCAQPGTVHGRRIDDTHQAAVEDAGRGIDEADLPFIVDEFFQARRPRTSFVRAPVSRRLAAQSGRAPLVGRPAALYGRRPALVVTRAGASPGHLSRRPSLASVTDSPTLDPAIYLPVSGLRGYRDCTNSDTRDGTLKLSGWDDHSGEARAPGARLLR
jgi:hypothetical protein